MGTEDLFQLFDMVLNCDSSHSFHKDELEEFFNDKIRPVTFNKGQNIVSIFQKASDSYLIVEGEYMETVYSVNGEKSLLATRTAPQLVGIVALVEKLEMHQPDAIATKPVFALEIDNRFLYEAMEKDGRIGICLIRNLAKKIIIASTKINSRLFFDARDNFLIYLCEQWKKHGATKDEYMFLQKNSSTADELGINERTLYRVLDTLKNEAIITVKHGKISLNSEQLSRLSLEVENILGELDL